MKIGLISDTHSYLDEKVFSYFDTCDEIWHAGDIGTLELADKLAAFKPLRAVHGNIDDARIQKLYPKDARFSCEGLNVWITHIGGYPPRYNPPVLRELRLNPPDIFVCGHSHILRVMADPKLGKLLYLNPGAAGQHGFHLIKTLLRFEINAGKVSQMQAIELGKRGAI
ncbi:MAG: metallophosphoesterase family protein [Bacteroidota bacterium]